MARPYYTLAIFEGEQGNGSRWAIAFGDYDREVVEQEMRDTYCGRDSYYGLKRGQCRILKTGPKQTDIDAAIAALNAKGA